MKNDWYNQPMKTIPITFAGFMALSLLVFAGSVEKANAIPVNKCARIIKSSVGSEILVNRCDVCMKIKVERKRPGNVGAVPTMRDYTMPAGSKQPLPFKGPGGTRISSESACKG